MVRMFLGWTVRSETPLSKDTSCNSCKVILAVVTAEGWGGEAWGGGARYASGHINAHEARK